MTFYGFNVPIRAQCPIYGTV